MTGHIVFLKNQQYKGLIEDVLQNEGCTDLVLIPDGEKILRCHQAYLAAVSPFFKAMLECHPQALRDVCISMPGVAYRDLKTAIDLVYNGKVFIPSERSSCITTLVKLLGFPCFSGAETESADSTVDILSVDLESDATPTPSKRPKLLETCARTAVSLKTQKKDSGKEKGATISVDITVTPDSGRSTRSSKDDKVKARSSSVPPSVRDFNANQVNGRSPRKVKKGSRLAGFEIEKGEKKTPPKVEETTKTEKPVRQDQTKEREKQQTGANFENGTTSSPRGRKMRVTKGYATPCPPVIELPQNKEPPKKAGRKRRVNQEPVKSLQDSDSFVFMSPLRSRSKSITTEDREKMACANRQPKVVIQRVDSPKANRMSTGSFDSLLNSRRPLVRIERLTMQEIQKIVKRWHCDHCGRTFNSHWLLALHRATQCEKVLPAECRSCDYKFESYVSHLLHLAKHNVEQYGKCPVCNCSDISNLDEHMFSDGHLSCDLKTYECDLCHVKFARQEDVAVHSKEVHKEHSVPAMENGSLSCERCNVVFPSSEELQEHKTQKKPETCCTSEYFNSIRPGMSRCVICEKLVFGDGQRLRGHLSLHVDCSGVISISKEKEAQTLKEESLSAVGASANPKENGTAAEVTTEEKKKATGRLSINKSRKGKPVTRVGNKHGRVCVYCNVAPDTPYPKHLAECSGAVFSDVGDKMSQCRICEAIVQSTYRHNHFRQQHLDMRRKSKNSSPIPDALRALLDQVATVSDRPVLADPSEVEDPVGNRPESPAVDDDIRMIVADVQWDLPDEVSMDTIAVPTLSDMSEVKNVATLSKNRGEVVPAFASMPRTPVQPGRLSTLFSESGVECVGMAVSSKRGISATSCRPRKSSDRHLSPTIRDDSPSGRTLTDNVDNVEDVDDDIQEIQADSEAIRSEVCEVVHVSPQKGPSEFVDVVCGADDPLTTSRICGADDPLEDTLEVLD